MLRKSDAAKLRVTGACGAAMNDDIFHGSGGCHHRAVLLSEESTFVRDLFLTDYHRESFLNHG